MRANDGTRTGGEILIDQLVLHGVQHAFCVPGESYLAALDAFHDRDVAVTVCRQEGGAVMMAEAVGKLTGRPGIAFVTRGPGATNGSPGLHIARQDSTPVIMFSRSVLVDGMIPTARAHELLTAETLAILGIGMLIYRRYAPRVAEAL